MTDSFIHLHNHTEYSLLDGAVRVDDLIARAQEYGMPAVAMTDHGVLYGIIEFYQKAREAGIKPLLGCEVYVTPSSLDKQDTRVRYHLVLLAMSNQGYHNLIKIVSRSWLKGFYYKPRVDKDLLYEYRDGLIALSGCLQGEVSQALLNDNRQQALKTVEDYQAIYGRENFYLELQDHRLPEEKKVNSRLLQLAREHDLPCVVSNDVHYLDKEDADLQDVMLALKTGTTIDDEDRLSFASEEFYFKSETEMRALFPDLEQAYHNTWKIAEESRVELDFSGFYLPAYPGKEDKEPEQLLTEKCEQGLVDRGLDDNPQARKRLEYELGIIEEMGYSSYFLIVWDFVEYARRQGIRVGPGRGSAAGSLVSYLLGITRINPLKYGLIFERFLNPQRVTMPDIDIDFDERRDEIIEYVKQRYGQEKVAQIGTFGTMAARAAIRDVGRALDVPYNKVDKLAKMVPSRPGITLEQAVESNQKLADWEQKDEQIESILEYARKLEGMPRHISTHAAGVIIGPEPLTNIVPLQYQDESLITQLPMEDLESMGLLKMDFLGLRNLTVIEQTLDLIEERTGHRLDIEGIPLDEPGVYQMLSEGGTLGVFQMESRLFRDLNQKLQPERFPDLIALLALGRPGPLGSGLVDDYIKSRHGEKEPEYLHPELEPILEDTFGLILYQEQVMEIASELAGYSMGEADLLRRAMGKKKPELMDRERQRFVDGARQRGIDPDTAHEIFDQMEYFGGYGFNKSHSAAYALIAYQTAYLKAKYPAEFMSALLSSVMNNLDKVGVYVEEAEEMGLRVLPPDINESDYDFTPTKQGNIRFGLKAIKNVGENAIKSIIEQRHQGPYTSLVDFLQRVELSQVNVRVVESLIKAGALDSFDHYRSQMLVKYEDIYSKVAGGKRKHSQGQQSFFDLVEDKEDFFENTVSFPEIEELDFSQRLNQERQMLGIYISGHPLDPFRSKMEGLTSINCADFSRLAEENRDRKFSLAGVIVNNRQHITRNNNRMAFLTVEDRSGKQDVIVFPGLYNSMDLSLESGEFILIIGRPGRDGGLVADRIFDLKQQFLLIEINGLAKEQFRSIKEQFSRYSGRVPVFFRTEHRLVLAGENYWVDPEDGLLGKLEKHFDRQQIQLLD